MTYTWGDDTAPYVFTDIGWGYNAGRWRHFAPQLVDAGYRFLAFDPPGHGHSRYADTPYPRRVALQRAIIEAHGRPALALAHSFGAGCLPETLEGLASHLRPQRIATLAPFSDLRYIFRQYADALGFGDVNYRSLLRAVTRKTGRHIRTMDPALSSRGLTDVAALIVHDPADRVTAYSNARILARHWPGSYLLEAPGAGHNVGDRETTRRVLAWLIDGDVPDGATTLSTASAVATHELQQAFRSLELTQAHGQFKSDYFQ